MEKSISSNLQPPGGAVAIQVECLIYCMVYLRYIGSMTQLDRDYLF